ncbi:hypothetical protein BOTBODRAFT_297409 [Botryobasidium botryosum FD-172 SS1]|uniref:Uncharacterized protein n=1 Tax=Botryobasidium botryosum (strain FD-172 SS1) TaxID=930990 RepID=A0A067MKN5_BOTB1|nr:hypothetical protein BOTBODRAFT_297409 [Botryobasidium botryosum FD-172 SS1]
MVLGQHDAGSGYCSCCRAPLRRVSVSFFFVFSPSSRANANKFSSPARAPSRGHRYSLAATSR